MAGSQRRLERIELRVPDFRLTAPRLPKADIGRSCVRFTQLDKVDAEVLRELVSEAAQRFRDNPDFGIAK